MRALAYVVVTLGSLNIPAAFAGPDMECPGGSQIEIGNCVHATLQAVDTAIESALSFAMKSAEELDEITGRTAAVPALHNSQAAWEAYRKAHCDYVGSTYGGGSGTGIAIESCLVMLGRARMEELLDYAG
ncbi:lysozyme inhibitor LprI family protein [Tropicimonas isoalkanivorans]|uniref:Uncharacterized conserved protein YecT, DUF1311 family n=1 Tax=Tropicimonas isoalkanivorans TaxID=441112 RepID=A0A1I1D974_9RHOB|nr:lysozyme inhibitor LprI family protein [Tropicimonas isoalkanivorans]SFB71485.1 Uncharacterized conserved protein YecT, DUF1311 family [Tropicimonas isoalkanivorans]